MTEKLCLGLRFPPSLSLPHSLPCSLISLPPSLSPSFTRLPPSFALSLVQSSASRSLLLTRSQSSGAGGRSAERQQSTSSGVTTINTLIVTLLLCGTHKTT